MNAKNVFAACSVAGVLLMSNVANAAILVSLSPTATNPGAATPGALNTGIIGLSDFTASGAIGGLASTLNINGFGLLGQSYSETGTINFTTFTGGTVGGGLAGFDGNLSAPGVAYGMYANFALSGLGNWNANVFSATTAVLTLGEIYGIHTGGSISGAGNVLLGTLALNYSQPLSATATLGLGGTALTSLTASFSFTPAAGTTGPNGFFQSANVFNMDISGANIGGNFLNTSFSPDPAVVGNPVVITVPGSQPNLGAFPGSVNVTFDNRVPEPGVLSLVALALIGLGLVSRRKAVSAA